MEADAELEETLRIARLAEQRVREIYGTTFAVACDRAYLALAA
jgi:hypothetical protein